MTTISTGTHFTKSEVRRYTENGVQGEHRTVIRYVVTNIDEVGFDADAVEVVSEEGRPSFAADPKGCQMAWFGWDAALGRGDVQIVEG